MKKITKTFGPIILSALSLLLTFNFLQPVAKLLGSEFNLLNNRGIGKVSFIVLIMLQIILFLSTTKHYFFNKFLEINFLCFLKKDFVKKFLKYFILFFLLHWLILFIFYMSGYITYNPSWGNFNISLIFKIIFGFITVFFLAWTEELIFRGTLFIYFNQTISTISSLIITSLIFMFAHNLKNPLKLVTTNWELGLGLFLLGVLLNLIFIDTRKLYTGMGAHAGLVFVKVLLRRIPFIAFLSEQQLPFWLNKDLRMSVLVHFLFLIAIIHMALKNKYKLLDQK